MNRSIIPALFFIFLVVSCGPVYETRYTYFPPETAEGRACVFQCENSKLQCQQIRDMEYRHCVDNADRDYWACEARNRYKSKDDKEYCYRSYCSQADYAVCDASYRTCYQSCGGRVSGETVCVSNCDQVKK